ncbi:hypothetical protein A167_01637 [Alcanivorax sp. S71-1-4]|uniref:TA system antitoxin ParD family protein n=1 Tax=Alcanivorax sp. S71-1-4 TaxID=1177159 RepID=UPI00135690F8|nr:hypothetical protein [Alcanivorax sp. S71-1-4]KAF0809566.1 hypothetical protein A167_01637 [Alcanivorax sp. S71-1-4]
MASPMRLDDALIRDAEAEARLNRRSLPKQIEFWADLGRRMARLVSPEDLIRIQLGLGRLTIEDARSVSAEPEDVFAAVDALRERGELSAVVTRAPLAYQAVPGAPGVLEQISRDGRRVRGQFINGEFVPQG